MQTALVLTAVLGFLGTIFLAGTRERVTERWLGTVQCLQLLCVVLWLGSVVVMMVFFPGRSSPDPRF